MTDGAGSEPSAEAPPSGARTAGAVRILYLEPSDDSARLLLGLLDGAERAVFSVTRAASLPEAKGRFMAETFDLVLVSTPLAEPQDFEALRSLSVQAAGAPLLVLTDVAGESLALTAVHKGTAQDYLIQGHLSPRLLEQSIVYAVSRRAMRDEVQSLRRRQESPFVLDRLTSLPNRAAFHHRLSDALDQARQNAQMVAVMLLSLEGFKLVHSTLGAEVGDPLLREIASRLRQNVEGLLGRNDLVARLSGDEFALVLSDVPQMKDAARAAESILGAFNAPFVLDGLEFFVSATIGISLFPFDGVDGESMLHNADIALRRAKEQGAAPYQYYLPAVNDRFLTRLELQNSLRIALARDEFIVHYMPQFDVRTGRIVSMEALARWRHPTLGLVPPADFIPLAEETGLILPIGERVLRSACAQVRAWQSAGLPPIRVSVNFSARQFQHQNPVALVARVLDETGLPPRHLELEITESAVMKDADAALATLRGLKETGIHLAIDDFGTGYSSLSYLRSFPIDALKVDRSFVRELTSRPEDEAIVSAVIAMAHSLRLKVIAEGVETARHLEWLQAKGCDEVQGYHFSKPVPAEQAAALLAKSAVKE